jgi:hypothetical protein
VAFTHSVLSHVPPAGGSLGKTIVRSRTTGTFTADPIRLADILRDAKIAKSFNGDLQAIETVTGVPSVGGAWLDFNPVVARFGPVTAATLSGTTATVTIASGHNIQTGEEIVIRQVQGSTNLNARFGNNSSGVPRVTRISDTQFSITGVANLGGAFSASANSIVQVRRPFASQSLSSYTNATQLFTTSAAHGLKVGDKLVISQITGLTGVAFQNKVVSVREVPSSTTFKVDADTTSTGVASGGVIIKVRTLNNFCLASVKDSKAIGLASVSNANPAVYTTGINHNLVIGDRVVVQGVAGTSVTALNVPAIVRTTPTATTLTLEAEDGAPISGSGSTATANTGFIFASGTPTLFSAPELELVWQIETAQTEPTFQGKYRGPFNL